MVKRPVVHIVFWLVYLVQDALLHYVWMQSILKDVSEQEQYWMAIKTALIVLPPKLLIVYYFVLFGVKKMLADKKNWILIITEIGVLLALSIMLFRMSFHYIINPHVYQLNVTVPLFNARNVLISLLEMGYITGIGITLKLLRMQIAARNREKEAMEREQILIREKLQAELKFLKNQTNPHFLFNTLNNIHVLARKKSDKTPEVVMKLSELLSFMLYETGKETISIADEVKIMEDYIDLEKIRYNEKLSVHVEKEIDDGSRQITPLILLPLIENAFKHGVSESRFDSFISINIKLAKGYLDFNIENSVENGSVKEKNNRIGLCNIKRQLELMYKEHELKIEDKEKTFAVNILINLNSYGKI